MIVIVSIMALAVSFMLGVLWGTRQTDKLKTELGWKEQEVADHAKRYRELAGNAAHQAEKHTELVGENKRLRSRVGELEKTVLEQGQQIAGAFVRLKKKPSEWDE